MNPIKSKLRQRYTTKMYVMTFEADKRTLGLNLVLNNRSPLHYSIQAEELIGSHPLDLTLAFQNDNPCKTHLRVRFTSLLHKNAFEASPAQAAYAKILFLYYSKVSTYSNFV